MHTNTILPSPLVLLLHTLLVQAQGTLKKCGKLAIPTSTNITADNSGIVQLYPTQSWVPHPQYSHVMCSNASDAAAIVENVGGTLAVLGTIKPANKTVISYNINNIHTTSHVEGCRLLNNTPFSTEPIVNRTLQLFNNGTTADTRLCIILIELGDSTVRNSSPSEGSSPIESSSPIATSTGASGTTMLLPTKSKTSRGTTTGVAVALCLLLIPISVVLATWYIRRRRRLQVNTSVSKARLDLDQEPEAALEQGQRPPQPSPRYFASLTHPSVSSIPQPPNSVEPPSTATSSIVRQVREAALERLASLRRAKQQRRVKPKPVLRAVNA